MVESPEKWYPSVQLQVSLPSGAKAPPAGGPIAADFDTGAIGLYVSAEYLESLGIRRTIFNAQQSAAMAGGMFYYYVRKLSVSLVGSTGETVTHEMGVHIIENFAESPLAQSNPKRVALVGRDVIALVSTLSWNWTHPSKRRTVLLKDWRQFEADVAAAFIRLGYIVEQDVNLAGNRIDLVLRQPCPDGSEVVSIVECKYTARTADVGDVRILASIRDSLMDRFQIRRAILVSSSGFTSDARLVSASTKVELLESVALFASADVVSAKSVVMPPDGHVTRLATEKRAFVVMPFSQDLLDTYVFGIREPLAAAGYVCTRTDEVAFSGRVMDKILDLMREADLVVAEVTEHNANVYYEVGIAHAMSKAVVLCTRSIESAPFDVRDLNHIVYASIRELREKLTARVSSIATVP